MTGRDDYIYGLRALADWLERHPDMPVPSTGRTSVTSLLFMPADRQAATAILAALPGEVTTRTWQAQGMTNQWYWQADGRLGGLWVSALLAVPAPESERAS